MSAKPSIKQGKHVETKLPGAFTLFEPSTRAFKANVVTILGLFLSPLVATIPLFSVAVGFAIAINNNGKGVHGSGILAAGLLAIYVAIFAFSIIVGAGLIDATVWAVEGKKPTYIDSIRIGFYHFWRFVGLSICVAALVLLGLILGIVPGLFLLKRYFLAPFYLVHRSMGIAEAMKQSAADTKQYGGVWGIMGVFALIELIGIIPFVGWIITLVGLALYACAPAIRYLQIQKLVDQAR